MDCAAPGLLWHCGKCHALLSSEMELGTHAKFHESSGDTLREENATPHDQLDLAVTWYAVKAHVYRQVLDLERFCRQVADPQDNGETSETHGISPQSGRERKHKSSLVEPSQLTSKRRRVQLLPSWCDGAEPRCSAARADHALPGRGSSERADHALPGRGSSQPGAADSGHRELPVSPRYIPPYSEAAQVRGSPSDVPGVITLNTLDIKTEVSDEEVRAETRGLDGDAQSETSDLDEEVKPETRDLARESKTGDDRTDGDVRTPKKKSETRVLDGEDGSGDVHTMHTLVQCRTKPYKRVRRLKYHPDLMHKCAHCDGMYTTKSGLGLHMRNKHDIDVRGKKRDFNLVPGLDPDMLEVYNQLKKTLPDHPKFDDEYLKENGKFWCKICDLRFGEGSTFREYFEAKHSALTCHFCQLELLTPKGFRTHNIERHRPLMVQCPVCDQLYKHKRAMLGHFKVNHLNIAKVRTKSIRVCTECGVEVPVTTYQEHVRAHREMRCGLCAAEFDSKAQCREHLRKVHGETCTQVCELCGQRFPSDRELMAHTVSWHSDRVPLERCARCGERYPYLFARQHRAGCGGHRQQYSVCELCGETVRNVAQHMRSHTAREEEVRQAMSLYYPLI